MPRQIAEARGSQQQVHSVLLPFQLGLLITVDKLGTSDAVEIARVYSERYSQPDDYNSTFNALTRLAVGGLVTKRSSDRASEVGKTTRKVFVWSITAAGKAAVIESCRVYQRIAESAK